SDLDLMLHMNNAAYVELLDNAGWESLAGVGLPPDAGLGHPEPLFYDIEYQASAQAGELVEVQSWFAPVSGQATDFERLQLVKGSGRTLAQARSRWGWRFPPDTDAPEVEARLARLWKE